MIRATVRYTHSVKAADVLAPNSRNTKPSASSTRLSVTTA